MKDCGGCHPIKVVALKTGLSPHLIRVWERRYGAVTPGRTDSRRRMYSEQEVERLKLLQMLTVAGHSIGTIATLGLEELHALQQDGGRTPAASPLEKRRNDRQATGRHFVTRALAAISDLDQGRMETALQEATIALGQQGVLVHVIAPLAEEVGAHWQDGTIGVAHEHFASALLRTFLGTMSRPFAPSEAAPLLISATPTGQLHEIGAMMISAAAASVGWRAVYLGASLGPQEIASAVHQKRAAVVGISLVYPADDPGIAGELRELKRLLPAGVKLLVGGRAAAAYLPVLDELRAIPCDGPLTDFMELLKRVREPATPSALPPADEKLPEPGPQ